MLDTFFLLCSNFDQRSLINYLAMDKTNPSNLRCVEFRPLKETVYDMLVASITSGELSPGTSA